MLLRHSIYYFLARGLPGLVNFVALAVYTRLLAPEEFGHYAVVLAGVGLGNVVVFQWLRLVLLRFLSAHSSEPHHFLSGMLGLFLTLAVAVTGIGGFLALYWPDPVWQRMLALAVPMLVTQAWFEFNLTLATARLKPQWYGQMLSSKAVLSLAVGGALAWVGLGAMAPLVGLLFAHVVAFLLFGLSAWRGVIPHLPSPDSLRTQLHYGLPLTITFALGWVVSGSDKLLLAWLLDERAVGAYAAGDVLAQQSLTFLLVIIHTAAYPLVISVLEQRGAEAARGQLVQNGELIIATALAGVAGLVVLGPQLVRVLIGEAFRAETLRVLPWLAVASALAGVKAYYFDIAFHLKGNSRWLVMTSTLAACVNVILNLMLIPVYGILGAAWATLGAFLLALVASVVLGRKVFMMPAISPILLKGGAVGMSVGFAAWLGGRLGGANWEGIVVGILLGGGAAFLSGLTVDLGRVRSTLLSRKKLVD